ncbi:phage portal protein [Clostridium botulinum]|uniref:Phage portal protein n=1 Tax=Clostridium botulinum TaxID=1491 RepID=A0A6B4JIX5_CLOBO|nr:phage portal protein [Clostridium botulinum]EES48509.1 phage portal protein, HK97 family [Clostridium botulinum E1 str. 'BoNT E Beluga']MBY6760570.1 phage portal protein [Clostridium botulinum]MBY6919477.1 phage portal protein [Clostridium botulinum]MCR1130355.1 phage portal protein [Clostridium botulinum]NFJ56890.1 phage portal protein [Clostridium botulinum]
MKKNKIVSKVKKIFTNEVENETIGTNPTVEELKEFFNTNIEEIANTKLTSTSYYSCMQIRCNAIAKLPLKLMQETEKGSIKAKDHNLYKLLKKRPNPFTNAHDFMWATEFNRLEYGNAFWVMDVNTRGQTQALYLLDSRKVTIMVDNTGILNNKNAVYYIYEDEKQGQIIYISDEIVHFKNFSMNGLKGTSIKKYIADTVENEQYSAKLLKDKYKNGLQDPIIVQYIGDLNDAKQQKIKKKFADMGGAKNAGKVVPIPTDFKVEQLETKLVNSQFFQLQGLTTRHIANAFGVKGFQLNDMEKSTYNNIEQQNKAFYSDTLQNVLTTYEQEMDYKVLTKDEEEKKGYYWQFNVDSILRSDLTSRTTSYQTGINTGYMTIAEVRAKENLPYIEGTDILIIGNGASIPLNDLGKQYTKGGGKSE